MLDRLGLAAAERTRKTLGSRAGLSVYEQLARNTEDPEARGQAILGALACALDVGDDTAIARGAGLWPTVSKGAFSRPIVEIAVRMAEAGRREHAKLLARAEREIRPDARVSYLLARLEETPAAFVVAEDRAAREGLLGLVAICRARRATLFARSGLVEQAIEAARSVDVERIGAEDLVRIARVLLGSPSRFVRAGAVSLLERAITGGDAACRRRALATALLHADDLGAGLSSLEADRVVSLVKRAECGGAVLARAEAIAAGTRARESMHDACNATPAGRALLHRVRAAREGGGKNMPWPAGDLPDRGGATGTSDRVVALAWLALDACVALRDGDRGAAALALMEIGRRIEPRVRAPRAVWTAVLLALGARGVATADAIALADRLLDARAEPPPQGYARLAGLLFHAGGADVAERALRRGAAIQEPVARAALARLLVQEAYRHARAGDGALALARLREAKRAS